MKEWISKVMSNNRKVAVPVMTHPGIEAIGKKVIDAVTNGEIHHQAIQWIADNYDTAVCTTIMDLTVEAEAFGCRIEFSDHEMPNVIGRLVHDEASVSALPVPDLTQGRVPEYLKAARLAVGTIKDRPVLAGCIGPFSLAGRLFDMSEIMVAIYIEPQTICLLLEKCTEFILNYCAELKKIGVSGVFMAEPAAGLLSDEDCMQYSTTFVRKIVRQLQDDDFTIVLHNCGNTGQCTPAMIASEAAALHFGNAVDMLETLKLCPSDLLVMGNLDPVGLFKQSDAETVKQTTLNLLKQTGEFNNFVISSGCDMPPAVPTANIQAFYEAIKEFNASIN